MPHSLHVKAQLVLANKENYPEVVVSKARVITNSFEHKRQAVQALWNSRELWHQWIRAKQQSNVRGALNRRRAATSLLKRTGFSDEDLKVLYDARPLLGKSPVTPIAEVDFKATCQLAECQNDLLVHKYLACVNAKRHDMTVAPVGFLQKCPLDPMAEVLAWKLLHRNKRVQATQADYNNLLAETNRLKLREKNCSTENHAMLVAAVRFMQEVAAEVNLGPEASPKDILSEIKKLKNQQ